MDMHGKNFKCGVEGRIGRQGGNGSGPTCSSDERHVIPGGCEARPLRRAPFTRHVAGHRRIHSSAGSMQEHHHKFRIRASTTSCLEWRASTAAPDQLNAPTLHHVPHSRLAPLLFDGFTLAGTARRNVSYCYYYSRSLMSDF